MELNVKYQTYGWLFYLSQALQIVSYWILANIFLLTAITLGIALEIEKLKNESTKQLLEQSRSSKSSKRSNTSNFSSPLMSRYSSAQDSTRSSIYDKVVDQNRQNIEAVEQVNRRGRRLICCSQSYAIIGVIAILCI